MKDQVKVPVLIASTIALVALAIFAGSKAMKAGDLDQGQIQYTPGKPPWMEKDPAKKGPPGIGGAQPAKSDAAPTNAPPGFTAPIVGSGK